MEITPEQIRAARALLRIEQEELASRAHVSVVTIRRLEAADAQRASATTREEVRQVLEQAGAEFVEGGVRRRRTVRPDAAARFEALRAISRRSAERLRDHEQITDADLYDENGLPR
jgi:transcriptional regulator with XRE-family HTH domain